jgi:hypothetical protein
MSNPLEEAINCSDGEQAAGLRAMRPNLSIDLLFPITDEVSAMLMAVKAEHLYAANIIDDDDRLEVLSRAAAFSPF